MTLTMIDLRDLRPFAQLLASASLASSRDKLKAAQDFATSFHSLWKACDAVTSCDKPLKRHRNNSMYEPPSALTFDGQFGA